MLASRRFMGLSLGGARRVRRRAFWLVSSPRRAALQLRDSTGIKPDFPRSSRMRFESQYIHRAPPRSRVPQPPRSSVLHSTMRVSLPLLIAQVAGMFCVFAVVLFGAAGTIAWPAGWAFLMLFFGFVIALSAWLIRYNPSLLTERMTGIGKSDQKLWDKFFFAALNGLFIVWLVTMPLDAVRFHWSNMPITLQLACAIALTVSFYFFYQTFKENAFLSPAVRIQTDRGQHVVTTGRTTTSDTPSEPNQEACSPGCASSRCSSPISRYASHSQPRSSSSPSSRRTHATCCAQPATHHAWGMSTKERSDPRPPHSPFADGDPDLPLPTSRALRGCGRRTLRRCGPHGHATIT